MDFFLGVLIGMALGVWLAVLALFLANQTRSGRIGATRFLSPVASAGGTRTPSSTPSATTAESARGVDPFTPVVEKVAPPANLLTFAEVDRASKNNADIDEDLQFLLRRSHRDEDQVIRLIRHEQQKNPRGEIADWVGAAAYHWRRDDR